jgi:large subunit ribosomal protein L1
MAIDKKQVLGDLKAMRESATERKFNQTVELIVNLKEINLKNPDEQVEFFMQSPNPHKKNKICAIVGGELEAESRNVVDFTITQGELDDYKKNKAKAKKLANEYDFFIAQANIMGQIAGAVGRVFGPRGKMPNPKAGLVVPPKTSLGPLYERLQSTVKISAKKVAMIQVAVGSQSQTDEELADNIMYFYNQIEHHLPKERHNVKNVFMKFTMGSPVKLQ